VHGRVGGQSRAEVKELGDATLPRRWCRRGHDERPVASRPFLHARIHAQQLLREFPVGVEVVLWGADDALDAAR
jgi:hypothetical protein